MTDHEHCVAAGACWQDSYPCPTLTTKQVDDYVEAASGQKGAPTPQTRRIIAALRAIGLRRSEFRAYTVRERDGSYGQALGSLVGEPSDPRRPDRLAIQHARLLTQCGLNVHMLAPEMAFVSTPKDGDQPHIVRHVAVSGAEREPLDTRFARPLATQGD